jgi:membrane associated rhomboid family serine protease
MSNRGTQQTSSLILVTSWLAILWLIFAADVILRALGFSLASWIGLRPRNLDGLWGILGCHFLHADIHHLASNSLGLLILGLLSCWYSQGLTGLAIISSALVSASLTWLIAPAGTIHIGASGVIFGLVGFLVCNGLFRRSWGSFLLALPIAVLLSGLIPGMLPTDTNRVQLISWQMHLGGFLGGALASWKLRRLK